MEIIHLARLGSRSGRLTASLGSPSPVDPSAPKEPFPVKKADTEGTVQGDGAQRMSETNLTGSADGCLG